MSFKGSVTGSSTTSHTYTFIHWKTYGRLTMAGRLLLNSILYGQLKAWQDPCRSRDDHVQEAGKTSQPPGDTGASPYSHPGSERRNDDQAHAFVLGDVGQQHSEVVRVKGVGITRANAQRVAQLAAVEAQKLQKGTGTMVEARAKNDMRAMLKLSRVENRASDQGAVATVKGAQRYNIPAPTRRQNVAMQTAPASSANETDNYSDVKTADGADNSSEDEMRYEHGDRGVRSAAPRRSGRLNQYRGSPGAYDQSTTFSTKKRREPKPTSPPTSDTADSSSPHSVAKRRRLILRNTPRQRLRNSVDAISVLAESDGQAGDSPDDVGLSGNGHGAATRRSRRLTQQIPEYGWCDPQSILSKGSSKRSRGSTSLYPSNVDDAMPQSAAEGTILRPKIQPQRPLDAYSHPVSATSTADDARAPLNVPTTTADPAAADGASATPQRPDSQAQMPPTTPRGRGRTGGQIGFLATVAHELSRRNEARFTEIYQPLMNNLRDLAVKTINNRQACEGLIERQDMTDRELDAIKNTIAEQVSYVSGNLKVDMELQTHEMIRTAFARLVECNPGLVSPY